MFEEIKKLEAELKKKKDAAINDLLKQRAELDKQLAELGHETAPVQKRRRRTRAEIEAEKAKTPN